MNRIAYMALKNIVFVPKWFYNICKMGKTNIYTEKAKYEYLRNIVKTINKSAAITVEVQGVENIPEKDGFLVSPNHQGLFDMLALIDACPNPLGVVIKKEASNIILVKQVIRFLNGIYIDRADIKESMKVILKVSEYIKGGRNFVIFPEGTRSRNGNNILDFKPGSFKGAVKAGAPIVPVALIDSFKPFDISSIDKVTVKVRFLPPIYKEQYMGLKTSDIAHIVHDSIKKEINENI